MEVQDTPPQPLASAKALATYGILEPILLRLPLRTLLLSQRVNKAFEDVIKRSKSIQQALFLEPSSVGPIVADTKEYHFKSPNYGIPQQPRFRDRRGTSTEWRLEESKEVVIPLLNPFFAATKEHCDERRLAREWHIDSKWNNCHWSTRITRARGWQDNHGMETDMFLTQPPIRNLANITRLKCFEITSETGITVKKICDTAKCEGPIEAIYLSDTDGYRFLGRSVDEISSREVLDIFARSVREHEYNIPPWHEVSSWEKNRLPEFRVDTWYLSPDGSGQGGS